MTRSNEIFARNLKRYMDLHRKTQKEMAQIIGVSAPTVHDWLKAKIHPRMDKVELIARYFNITKADLVEEHPTHLSPVEVGNFVRKQRETDKGAMSLEEAHVFSAFVRETFPQRLKHYMQIHGKKRTDLVRDLNFKYSTVSDWEKGITIPRMDKAEALARYFNITVADLVGEAKTLSVVLDIPFGKLMGVQVDTEQIQRQRFRERLYKEIPNLVLSDEEIAQVINYIKFVISQRT